MKADFHEPHAEAKISPPSDRSTGLVFAAVALIIAFLWRDNFPVVVLASLAACILAAISLLRPSLLHRAALAWFRLGLLLHKVVNPVIMLLMFAVAIIPTGLIMRRWYDPLNSRKTTRNGSYWMEREAADPKTNSMRNQF
jgi:hypothetical protein